MTQTNVLNKWRLDLSGGGIRTVSKSSGDQGLNPPGYNINVSGQSTSAVGHSEQQQQKHLLTKRAWEVALQPAKTLPMNMFMMYMAGNTISIFPIMMVAMMVWRPIKALMSVNGTFKPLEQENIGSMIIHKFVFVLGNFAAVALAVYKCHGMGLLPNTASDWLDFLPTPQQIQHCLFSEVYG